MCAWTTSASGGAIQTQPAAGEPLNGLTSDQLDRFTQGQFRYNETLTAPQGLGPVFNKASCGNCHNAPVGGPGSQAVTRFGFIDEKGNFDPLDELGGSLLQIAGIQIPDPENPKLLIDCFEFLPDKSVANVTAFRVTNGAMGYGLVEAIADGDLLDVEAAQAKAGLVSGKAHIVGAFEDDLDHVGRFGWKAQVPSMLTFSGDASLNEMGLTNQFVGEENLPNGDAELLATCDLVADPEDQPDGQGVTFVERVTDFQRFLAPPPQTPRSGMAGEAVFMNIGCGECHSPSFTTPDDPALEDSIRNKAIRPYSDFLLHDMGDLGDLIVQGDAEGREMKTPPLWGVRYRDPMLHDGRVGAGDLTFRLTEVIGWHGVSGSEAQFAAANYNALSQAEKDQLLAFIDSLGRREFDFDYEQTDVGGTIDIFDWFAFADCYGGGPYSPDDACAIGDVNQDGFVDATDAEAFATVFPGFTGDCNENGVNDLVDILDGTSTDKNDNVIPDECECPADFNGDKVVDGADLGQLLLLFGTFCFCPQDLTGNFFVDGADLGQLLLDWGTCGN